MKDLGSAKMILGIDILKDRVAGILFLSQSRYVSKVLENYSMLDSKPVMTLWELNLNSLMTCSNII